MSISLKSAVVNISRSVNCCDQQRLNSYLTVCFVEESFMLQKQLAVLTDAANSIFKNIYSDSLCRNLQFGPKTGGRLAVM